MFGPNYLLIFIVAWSIFLVPPAAFLVPPAAVLIGMIWWAARTHARAKADVPRKLPGDNGRI
jgi:hypothetical protein